MKKLFAAAAFLMAVLVSASAQPAGGPGGFGAFGGPRTSVLITNDLSGDVDGIFALAHQLLCTSSEVKGIVGTHLNRQGAWTGNGQNTSVVDQAVSRAEEVLALLGQTGRMPVVAGAQGPMEAADKPVDSPGARLIIEQAHKASPQRPLYVTVGASLTDVASAWLLDPSISENIIVVWIGGQEYPFGHPFPPEHNKGQNLVEYNARLDIKAFQTVFNLSDLKLVQIPRDVYRQCLYGISEIQDKIAPCGQLGEYLSSKLRAMGSDTYVLGDSPMVLISTLTTTFEPGAASSFYETVAAPHVTDEGLYDFDHPGRMITVYRTVDTRLLFGDMESRIRNFSRSGF